jgi:hypothetical protein
MQPKVICKLSLTIRLRKSNSFLLINITGQFSSLDLRMNKKPSKKSSIFCKASSFLQLNEVQDTHVCVWQWWAFEAAPCPRH